MRCRVTVEDVPQRIKKTATKDYDLDGAAMFWLPDKFPPIVEPARSPAPQASTGERGHKCDTGWPRLGLS